MPKDTAAYIQYFCGQDTSDKTSLKDNEPRRLALYTQSASFMRAFAAIANEMDDAGYSLKEIKKIRERCNIMNQFVLK